VNITKKLALFMMAMSQGMGDPTPIDPVPSRGDNLKHQYSDEAQKIKLRKALEKRARRSQKKCYSSYLPHS
jgi:hypothetical protein